MEKKLSSLFEYQRFEGNPRLAKMIREAENRSAQALNDDDLFFVSAAGEPQKEEKDQLK